MRADLTTKVASVPCSGITSYTEERLGKRRWQNRKSIFQTSDAAFQDAVETVLQGLPLSAAQANAFSEAAIKNENRFEFLFTHASALAGGHE